MYQFAIVFQMICIVAALMLVIKIAKKQPSRAQKYLLISAISVFLHCACYFLELTATNAEVAIVTRKLQQLCVGFSTMMAMIFIFHYCRVKLPKPVYYIFLLLVLFSTFVAFTDEVFHLQYSSYEFINDDGFPYLKTDVGSLYLVNIITQMAEMTTILAITSYRIVTGRKQDRKRYVPIYIIIFNSFALCAVHHMGLLREFNPRSLELLIIIVISVGVLYKNNLFRVVMSAKERLVDYMDDALIILDYNRNFMDANYTAEKLFPVLKYALDGDEVPELVQYIEALHKENVNSKVYTINERHYKCSIRKVFEGHHHKGYTMQFVDITDEREYALKLMELTNQAEEANRAKSRFLANMSHEIRTPMNAIIGMSEIILRTELDKVQRTNVESILFSSESLLNIINNILDLSKIESGKLELAYSDYHIESILHNIYNVCSMRLEERPIKFELITNPEMPTGFNGDAQRINEIMTNLLGNSIKYCTKGNVKLEVGGRYIDTPDDKPDYFMLEITVSDTGMGIKQEDIEKIFDAYTRTDISKNRNTIGTGLGLAIVKNYVTLMNGDIRVESVYGEGTTFYVNIPQLVVSRKPLGRSVITMEDLRQKREGMYKSLKNSVVFNGAKVLVVDDVRVNLVVAMGLLKPYNIKVDTATSGREAIEKVSENKYDVVFMDHMMPEMDGVEATKVIRSFDDVGKSQVTIIALTANAVEGTEEMFFENGFNDYLSKPIDIKKLEKLLKKWLIKYKVQKEDAKDNKDENKEEQKENDFTVLKTAGLYTEQGIKLAGGQKDVYKLILGSFYDSFRDFNQDLITVAKENLQGFEILIHGITGTLNSIGAIKLSEIAKQIEQAAIEHDTDYIHDIVPEFEKEFLQTVKYVGDFLNNE